MPTLPKFYTAPVVTLVARPQFVEPAHLPVNWIGEATDGEKLVEYAGRVCYMSQDAKSGRDNRAYLANILESRHGSVLENVTYSVLIEGVSRALTHELIRHRAGTALSQLSQRFVDSSTAAFVVPPALIGSGPREERFRSACLYALDAYEELTAELCEQFAGMPDKTLRRKRAREAARSVLPNATETKLVWTANLRSYRHVLELRGSTHADAEIQRLARALYAVLEPEAPNAFQDFVITDTGEVRCVYSKV